MIKVQLFLFNIVVQVSLFDSDLTHLASIM